MVKVIASVSRINFPKDGRFTGFWAGKVNIDRHAYGCNGTQMLEIGAKYELIGDWITDPKWGKQFKFNSATQMVGKDVVGFSYFLSSAVGVSHKNVVEILDACGNDFIEVMKGKVHIKYDPERVGATLDKLMAFYTYNTDLVELAWAYMPYGLKKSHIERLYEIYDSRARIKIADDPYTTLMLVRGIGFLTADRVAMATGVAKDAMSRVKAIIMYCLETFSNEGHTMVQVDEMIAEVCKLSSGIDTEKIIRAMESLGRTESIQSTELGEYTFISDTELIQCELFIQSFLRKRCRRGRPSVELFDEDGFEIKKQKFYDLGGLNDGQQQAVKMADEHKFSVITGPAGSGKTYVIRRIVDMLDRQGCDIALCAPTGKAARRMESSIGRPASTIHRLLCYNKDGGFTFDDNNKLPNTAIIVDEVSMVDVRLARALLCAVREDCKVIFVGDKQQLPPVGPGNVLRDVLSMPIVPITELTEVVRQAGKLQQNSTEILSGTINFEASDDWRVIGNLQDSASIIKIVEGIFSAHLRDKTPVLDIQVLSPQSNGEAGVFSLNNHLRRVYLEFIGKSSAIYNYQEGDKVIYVRNNYDLGIMNGSIGIVQRDDNGDGVSVFWSDTQQEIFVPKADFDDLKFAYALTVHKVQGSEFPFVISVIDPAHHYMHNSHGRNLIYTAVTRASKRHYLVGCEHQMAQCAAISRVKDRITYLGATAELQ